jgi:hypothetical protein
MAMAVSHRLQITLTDEQYQRLLAERARTGASLAELIRGAVAGRYDPEPTLEQRLQLLRAGVGAWANRDDDSDPYEEWRRLRPPLGPPPD